MREYENDKNAKPDDTTRDANPKENINARIVVIIRRCIIARKQTIVDTRIPFSYLFIILTAFNVVLSIYCTTFAVV